MGLLKVNSTAKQWFLKVEIAFNRLLNESTRSNTLAWYVERNERLKDLRDLRWDTRVVWLPATLGRPTRSQRGLRGDYLTNPEVDNA